MRSPRGNVVGGGGAMTSGASTPTEEDEFGREECNDIGVMVVDSGERRLEIMVPGIECGWQD